MVRHGEAVETRPDRFVEGAWDGDFATFDFDLAPHLVGSGGVLRDGACVFASPFHPLEWLYVLQQPDQTFVSNSLVFLLQEAGDALDLSYPNYFFDLLRTARYGLSRQPSTTPTREGGHVELYTACRLVIDSDLRLRRTPQPLGPPPANYSEYFDLLSTTSKRIVTNAADPARATTYTPVAACSRGYDSTASAALAKMTGCTEGVTYARSGLPTGHPIRGFTKPLSDDSGTECLQAMGMNVSEFDRVDALGFPGHPKAEFFYSLAATTDASTLAMEGNLRGSVFFTGRHGERYWGPTKRGKTKYYRETDDCNLSGRAASEFRLRVGFINFPAPYIGALHGPALLRITHSEEMRPWKLGVGYYDRPIARRLAEEAGVPRECFGHVKFGGGEEACVLTETSERDFQGFLRSAVPEAIRRRMDPRPIVERDMSHHRLKYLRTNYSHWPLASPLLELLQTDRLHKLWNSLYLYTFHWGFEKVRSSYVVAGHAKSGPESALHVA